MAPEGQRQAELPLQLGEGPLDFADLAAVAREGRRVAIAPEGLARLAESRRVVERYIEENLPAYGLTTGLGSRVTHRLSREDMADFSRRTILGRSVALGPPLPLATVRAAMTVRLQGLLAGGSGASPAVAELLAGMLNEGVTPLIPSSGSIGASDLCLMAHMGLAMLGEGEAFHGEQRKPAREALRDAGLTPLAPQPKDGLAIINASSVAAATAALALHDAWEALSIAQAAAALSLEGFRANLTPLDPRMAAARPQPGQAWAAADLLNRLAGSQLFEPGAARRLQDPISLRCIAPVHGSLRATLDFAGPAVEAEVNGRGDNPLVLTETEEILSSGNFQTPLLALSLDSLTQAMTQVAALSLSRSGKLLTERLSGLPPNLSPLGPGQSGFAPLMKAGEALIAELRHLSQPVSAEPRWASDGVEDDLTNAALAARKAIEAVGKLRLLLAIELAVGAQAVELAAPPLLGREPALVLEAVRATMPPVEEDRPLSPDIMDLERELLASGRLLALLQAQPERESE